MSVKSLVFVAVGLMLLYLSFTVGAPFLLALIVAIFLEPVNQLLMKRARVNRIVAVIISCTLFTLLLLALATGIGFKLTAELIAFWNRAPAMASDANVFLLGLIDNAKELYTHIPPDSAVQLEKALNGLVSSLTGMVTALSRTIVNFASGLPGMFIFSIVFIVAVYMFSFSLNTMRASFLSLFHEESRPQVGAVLDNLKNSVFGFLRSQLLLSLVTYVITLIGLVSMRVDYAMAIALLVVIVDILPILGTGSVLVPWAAYMLLTGHPGTAIGLVLLFIIITVVRRIIEPKILGDSVGIGAISALISLYVGFKLVGVIGVFLGPLVVIIYMAARKAGLFQLKIRL
ncbi:sporulation integral membrane protein YtvI [Paenibacillaceae bacterium GAS479]|nr:sporulation integral membrane protein YtvI [Paenibacillaceae bacterium GAS479]